ncbi:MAG: hypothetical protein ACKOQW_01275 [Phycisphaerales bacterium]
MPSHHVGTTDGACRAAAALALTLASVAAESAIAQAPPRCASAVVRYVAGEGAGASYQDPLAALGAPTRFTGEGVYPSCVTPFNGAFMPGELVSVGRGGELVVSFDAPVVDDPRNPFGIDLIVYGNSFCIDASYPEGIVGGTYNDGGTVDVSADGIAWVTVPAVEADGGLPTLGFADIGPYDVVPGQVPTDPARPVDPTIATADLEGLTWPELLAVYDGTAGGTRIDLSDAGIASIRFVRIRVAANAAAVPEIDAVVAVRPGAGPADLNGDGAVNGDDLGIMLGAWGPCSGCAADLDQNGNVDGDDLGSLLGSWT